MIFRVLVSDVTQHTTIHARDCVIVNRASISSHWHDLEDAPNAKTARNRFEAENEIVKRGLPKTTICACTRGATC